VILVRLEASMKSLAVDVKLIDQRVCGLPVDLTFHGVLRAEQQQAADALLQQETGVLSASTAFGKTVVATYQEETRSHEALTYDHSGAVGTWALSALPARAWSS